METIEFALIIVSVASSVLKVKQNRYHFALKMLSEIVWIIFDIQKGLYGCLAMGVINLVISFWGYGEWKKSDNQKLKISKEVQ
ncbi:MAG: nicotinamide mononucleotide transporter family protein [Oscillospiraceae bacterium]|nr:nicotinamide mononucleotide transporter family protein [Oscillospiraceae bacterium]